MLLVGLFGRIKLHHAIAQAHKLQLHIRVAPAFCLQLLLQELHLPTVPRY
jgi:hypothetical protein